MTRHANSHVNLHLFLLLTRRALAHAETRVNSHVPRLVTHVPNAGDERPVAVQRTRRPLLVTERPTSHCRWRVLQACADGGAGCRTQGQQSARALPLELWKIFRRAQVGPRDFRLQASGFRLTRKTYSRLKTYSRFTTYYSRRKTVERLAACTARRGGRRARRGGLLEAPPFPFPAVSVCVRVCVCVVC